MKAPESIHYDRTSRTLTLTWRNSESFDLSAEFLRVHSPSAEVRGHGVGQETLQVGKKDVAINGLEPTGRYALKIVFDDGHDSGLYDWKYLRHLCDRQDEMWNSYLEKLEQAGASRTPMFITAKQL
jgi:DUF971 family protein